MPRVANTRRAPCETQKEIAAQNSYLATVKAQKEVVYAAPCEIEKKPQPQPAQKVAQNG